MKNRMHEPKLDRPVFHVKTGKRGVASCSDAEGKFHVRFDGDRNAQPIPVNELVNYEFVEYIARGSYKEENKNEPTDKEILKYAQTHLWLFETN